MAALQELASYWANEYDVGRVKARLKALPQYTTEIDGVELHFIHVRSRHEDAMPLIMTHGWPGSVIELLETVGPLTDPTALGGTPDDAFHLVLPSLPGYGFSGTPTELESPVGLAAWMLDHDTDSYYKISRAFVAGEPVGKLTRDSVLDNITLYWLTGTGASAARWYWEFGQFLAAAGASGPRSSARHRSGRLHRVPR